MKKMVGTPSDIQAAVVNNVRQKKEGANINSFYLHVEVDVNITHCYCMVFNHQHLAFLLTLGPII
jgi:hypothetical protein